jgi:orotate phosphoribosyltransferase-like protein
MTSNDKSITTSRGRPGDVPETKIRRIRQLRAQGLSYGEIARKLDLPRSTVRYHASHDAVREERRQLWAKNHPRLRIIHCTKCDAPGHNAATCNA